MTKIKENLEYLSSPYLLEIQELFIECATKLNINNEVSSVREIREFMFEFFQRSDFNNLYFKVASQIVEHIKIPREDCVLQMLPTPRVFRPNSIGTSYHCDYWYGHGEKSYTVWVPLSSVEVGNTFHVANDYLARQYVLKLEESKSYQPLPIELASLTTPVLPKKGQAFLFNSKLLHGSPLNNSNSTRLSFDFRISSKSDPTSTKDLENYYHNINEKFQLPKHELDGARVLKYICGGIGKNTFIQHIVIEAAAKRFNMNVYEQEAEIERLGYPIFAEYISGKIKESKLDGMIIASKNILDNATIELAANSDIKIWCALENNYL